MGEEATPSQSPHHNLAGWGGPPAKQHRLFKTKTTLRPKTL